MKTSPSADNLRRIASVRDSSLNFDSPMTPGEAKAEGLAPLTAPVTRAGANWILWKVAGDMASAGIKFRLVREKYGLALWRDAEGMDPFKPLREVKTPPCARHPVRRPSASTAERR